MNLQDLVGDGQLPAGCFRFQPGCFITGIEVSARLDIDPVAFLTGCGIELVLDGVCREKSDFSTPQSQMQEQKEDQKVTPLKWRATERIAPRGGIELLPEILDDKSRKRPERSSRRGRCRRQLTIQTLEASQPRLDVGDLSGR